MLIQINQKSALEFVTEYQCNFRLETPSFYSLTYVSICSQRSDSRPYKGADLPTDQFESHHNSGKFFLGVTVSTASNSSKLSPSQTGICISSSGEGESSILLPGTTRDANLLNLCYMTLQIKLFMLHCHTQRKPLSRKIRPVRDSTSRKLPRLSPSLYDSIPELWAISPFPPLPSKNEPHAP